MLLLEAKHNSFDFVVELCLPQCHFCSFVLSKKKRQHDVKVVAVVTAGCQMIFCVVTLCRSQGPCLVSAMLLIRMVRSSSHAPFVTCG